MKNKNTVHLEGYLYEHDLKMKESGPNSKNPGTKYITGTISIATDDEMNNIVPVHFTYTTALTSTGKVNSTFGVLEQIVNGALGTVMKDGKENAVKLNIDSAIGLNEFYSERDGQEELVSAKRNEGGFVHVTDKIDPDEKKRNVFECDFLIKKVTRMEANEEKDLAERVILDGAIFDFRKSLLPVSFVVYNPNAMNYFESLEVSPKQPVFTKVFGRQLNTVTVRKIVEEGAFGEDIVKEVPNSRKDFVIWNARKEIYDWDDANTITVSELNEAISNRETYLAALKQRQEEYKNSKALGDTAIPTSVASGEFKF